MTVYCPKKAIIGNGFTLIPIDSIPEKDYSKRKGWRDLTVQEWKWHHFLWYYVETYNVAMDKRHRKIQGAEFGKYKGMIERAMELRGNEVLKGMIDKLFLAKDDDPQWTVSLDMVCGSDPRAQRFAELVEDWGAEHYYERLVEARYAAA